MRFLEDEGRKSTDDMRLFTSLGAILMPLAGVILAARISCSDNVTAVLDSSNCDEDSCEMLSSHEGYPESLDPEGLQCVDPGDEVKVDDIQSLTTEEILQFMQVMDLMR